MENDREIARFSLKRNLWDLVETIEKAETRDDAMLATLRAAIDALLPLSPVARPIEAESQVEGHWIGRFAHFGVAHSRGKSGPFETNLGLLSFGALPKLPIVHSHTNQEIRAKDKAYNNVTQITTLDGLDCGHIVVRGRYFSDAENPQRFHVSFYGYTLLPPKNVHEKDYRMRLGLDEKHPLNGEYRPPKLHSDIVYLDEDTRINFGNMGGVYVLERAPGHPGVSVDFTDAAL